MLKSVGSEHSSKRRYVRISDVVAAAGDGGGGAAATAAAAAVLLVSVDDADRDATVPIVSVLIKLSNFCVHFFIFWFPRHP
jgi:hypothetical protein